MEGRRSRGQAIFVYSYLGKTWTKFIIDNSFASMHPCIFASNFSLTSCPPVFCSSDLTHPFTSPPLKGGEKEPSPHPSPTGEGAAHVAYSHNIRRAAFTLAEVLITLGIIGVVAAMTIPSIVAKFQHKALESQFKKTASIISQVYLKTKSDTGIDDFISYCTTYSNDSGVCPYSEECYQALYKNLVTFSAKQFYNGNSPGRFGGTERTTAFKTYNNKQSITKSNSSGALKVLATPLYSTVALPDGSFIDFLINERSLYIVADVNGEKKPNKLGHDVFFFMIRNDKLTGMVPDEDITDEEIENGDDRTGNPCNMTSNQKANGVGCAHYALMNKCPYDDTKTYFECLP